LHSSCEAVWLALKPVPPTVRTSPPAKPLHTGGPCTLGAQTPWAEVLMARVSVGVPAAATVKMTADRRPVPDSRAAVPSLVNRLVVHLLRTLPPQVRLHCSDRPKRWRRGLLAPPPPSDVLPASRLPGEPLLPCH